MHDPTEGGIATGLREITDASGTGLVVKETSLLMADETREICRFLDCDPLGLISSGCLLLTLSDKHVEAAVSLLSERGFPVAHIGFLVDHSQGSVMEDAEGAQRPMPQFAVDELASV